VYCGRGAVQHQVSAYERHRTAYLRAHLGFGVATISSCLSVTLA
jgi:hypothetical protein